MINNFLNCSKSLNKEKLLWPTTGATLQTKISRTIPKLTQIPHGKRKKNRITRKAPTPNKK